MKRLGIIVSFVVSLNAWAYRNGEPAAPIPFPKPPFEALGEPIAELPVGRFIFERSYCASMSAEERRAVQHNLALVVFTEVIEFLDSRELRVASASMERYRDGADGICNPSATLISEAMGGGVYLFTVVNSHLVEHQQNYCRSIGQPLFVGRSLEYKVERTQAGNLLFSAAPAGAQACPFPDDRYIVEYRPL